MKHYIEPELVPDTNASKSEGGLPMKRVITGTCLAAAFAVGLAAQTPSQTPQTTPSTPQTPPSASYPSASSQDRDSAKTVTVTGCLKAGESADSFVLSDLKWGGSKGGAIGTSGSTAPAEIGSATTLKIVPGSTKLSEHVGHQVEITGTADKSSSSSSATSPSDPAAPRPSATASASAPSFQAKSVKMVSATCSM
jgi:hypothetical protein